MTSSRRNSHAEAQRRRREKVRSFDALRLILLLCASAPMREITYFLALGPALVNADEPVVKEEALRAAIEKSLPLLQEGARTFRERSEGRCISCHHQGLVLSTVALARQRGF